MFSSIPLLPFGSFSWAEIALAALCTVITLLLGYYIYRWPYQEYMLSFRNLRGPCEFLDDMLKLIHNLLTGPENGHWFYGQLRGIIKAGPMELQTGWIKQYGSTFRYRIIFGTMRFFTADPTALSYILNNPELFPKPEQMRRNMGEMLGEGVLVAEGADHRRQRKVLNPSFSAAAVKEMVPIFYDKAYDLKDKLLNMIEDESIETSPTPPKPEDKVVGGRKIDVSRYLAQCTLDIIGAAGFDYDFAALRDPKNELAEAYRQMFQAGQNFTIMAVIQNFVPLLNKIVSFA